MYYIYADDTKLYIKFDVTAKRVRRTSLLIFEHRLPVLDDEIVYKILLLTFHSQHATATRDNVYFLYNACVMFREQYQYYSHLC